jgi:DUF4097 and DUF4098 domain-containing protein YvlB
MFVGLALALAADAGALDRVETRRNASPDGVIAIDNPAGSIKVVGWDRAELVVTGDVGPGGDGVDVSGSGRRISIDVSVDGNPHAVQSHLEVKVPAGSRVEINGFMADITVSGVKGEVTAETVNGSIVVSDAPREVSANSVNGSVEISGATRLVKAESVNGAVTVSGGSGVIEASTVNGVLRVTGGTFDRVDLETVAGGVRFAGGLSGKATLSVESVSGGVDLAFPEGVSADFTVSTFSGGVDNALGPPARRSNRYTSEKELEFSTGGGGATVNVHTLSGSIAIRKK